MDFVNIIYRYVNRFINSEELIHNLESLDKEKFSKQENEEIEKIIKEVKEIVKTIPIKIDQIEINRLTMMNRLLDALDEAKISDSMDENKQEETRNFIQKRRKSLLEDQEKVRDSGPRYEALYDCLVENKVYTKYCKNMNDLELLEFITQFISVPVTPNIDQETFDDLVEAGIKKDNRESLWRLAMNYNCKGKDFSKIEDYFIEKRDNYYLAELISGVNEDLNLDRLTQKVLNTGDSDFIKKLASTDYLQDIFSEKQKEQVKEFLKEKRNEKNE